jgi:hypothetical protein
MNELIIELHQLRNQAKACNADGIPPNQFEQYAKHCINTYHDLRNKANANPYSSQIAEVQQLLNELEGLITWLCLKR